MDEPASMWGEPAASRPYPELLRTLGGGEPDGEEAAELPARVADRYRPLELIGRGGMGSVWRAHDERLGREVALKVLRADVADARSIDRFREEVAIAARLEHPGIVAVHDVGLLADGRPWYTMRLVRGVTLESRIVQVHRAWRLGRTDEGSSLRRLLEAFLRVCETVAYAHAAGVVHRDLKPSNVMLGPFGEVLVLDWGLARLVAGRDPGGGPERPARPARTLPGAIAGTPGYMSPEQARGHADRVGPEADVHALGATLYDVLCERPPRLGRDCAELLALVARGSPVRPPSAVAPRGIGVDDELDRICLQALAPEPVARYPHAGALAAEIARWLDGTERRERGARLVADAEAALRQAELAEADARALADEAAVQLGRLPPNASPAAAAGAWELEDRARARRAAAGEARARAVAFLRAALAHAPDLAAAHDALADDAWRRHRDLQRAGRHEEARAAELELREHDRTGRYAPWLAGVGALTLVTDPPGAEVRLYRYEERRRRRVAIPERVLGRTPLVEVPLPMGSWLCEIRLPGRVPVRYPVHVGRLEHWDGVRPGDREPLPIVLPTRDQLRPGDVHVPAGWFLAGDPPFRRRWADALVVRRFPVTVGEYCAWLDHLDATGGDVERALPRIADSDEPFLERGPDGRWAGVRTDMRGLHWDAIPRGRKAPIVLVTWEQAVRYAAARAALDGLPWRLLAEAEWEKAARGVDGRAFPWGDHFHPAWCRMKQSAWPPAFTEVGAHRVDRSPYGVRDTAGNVAEWVLDPDPLPAGTGDGPIVAVDASAGQRRVAKGGTYTSGPQACRAAARWTQTPVFRGAAVGLRLCRSFP